MSLFLKESTQEIAIEMFPDAWKRFHGAVHMMAKASPQHRPAIGKFKPETGKAPRRRAKKVYRHQ